MVLDRMAFEADPEAFLESCKAEQDKLTDKLLSARSRLTKWAVVARREARRAAGGGGTGRLPGSCCSAGGRRGKGDGMMGLSRVGRPDNPLSMPPLGPSRARCAG
jgi:hypothetical protein